MQEIDRYELVLGTTYDVSWSSYYTHTPCHRQMAFEGYDAHYAIWRFEGGIIIHPKENPVFRAVEELTPEDSGNDYEPLDETSHEELRAKTNLFELLEKHVTLAEIDILLEAITEGMLIGYDYLELCADGDGKTFCGCLFGTLAIYRDSQRVWNEYKDNKAPHSILRGMGLPILEPHRQPLWMNGIDPDYDVDEHHHPIEQYLFTVEFGDTPATCQELANLEAWLIEYKHMQKEWEE